MQGGSGKKYNLSIGHICSYAAKMQFLAALVVFAVLTSPPALAHPSHESRAAFLRRRHLLAAQDVAAHLTHVHLDHPGQHQEESNHRSILQADDTYDDAADRQAAYDGYYEDGVKVNPKNVKPGAAPGPHIPQCSLREIRT
jgi:hypothetical protein